MELFRQPQTYPSVDGYVCVYSRAPGISEKWFLTPFSPSLAAENASDTLDVPSIVYQQWEFTKRKVRDRDGISDLFSYILTVCFLSKTGNIGPVLSFPDTLFHAG